MDEVKSSMSDKSYEGQFPILSLLLWHPNSKLSDKAAHLLRYLSQAKPGDRLVFIDDGPEIPALSFCQYTFWEGLKAVHQELLSNIPAFKEVKVEF